MKKITYFAIAAGIVLLTQAAHCQTDTTSAQGYISKAQNAVSLSLNDLAIKYYTSAIEIDPMLEVAQYELGCLYTDMELYNQAIPYLLAAIDINPNNANAHERLAYIHTENENYDEAYTHAQKAIELNPTLPSPYSAVSLSHIYPRSPSSHE